jgi:hypothetical protein
VSLEVVVVVVAVVLLVLIPCAEILDIPKNPIGGIISASIPIGVYIILLCKLLFHGHNCMLRSG